MSTEVIIIGGLLDNPNREELIDALKSDVSDVVEWDWIECTAANGFQPPRHRTLPVLDKLGKWRAAQRRRDEDLTPEELHVVKLVDLHGKTANLLFGAWPEPILVPEEVRTAAPLLTWLKLPEAGLFPPREWWAALTEAAVVAILSKLLKKKHWNRSVQGHNWTKEEHLLNEAPVKIPERPAVSIEASRMLDSLDRTLLLAKGAGQGKTPREWSINENLLTAIKQMMIKSSIEPLRDIEALDGLVARMEAEDERIYRLDGIVVTERVLAVCRQR